MNFSFRFFCFDSNLKRTLALRLELYGDIAILGVDKATQASDWFFQLLHLTCAGLSTRPGIMNRLKPHKNFD